MQIRTYKHKFNIVFEYEILREIKKVVAMRVIKNSLDLSFMISEYKIWTTNDISLLKISFSYVNTYSIQNYASSLSEKGFPKPKPCAKSTSISRNFAITSSVSTCSATV